MLKQVNLINTQDERVNRGKTQKIYLINRNVDDNNAMFDVMGTTGNIYSVKLTGSPTCTCPDFCQRKKRCKHIFFMLAKLFDVPDPHKEKFTEKEIVDYIKKYKTNIAKFTVKFDLKALCLDVGANSIDDNCVICMDEILNGEDYVYCKKSCGRCVHHDCFDKVIRAKFSSKCPYCMQKFECSVVVEGNIVEKAFLN